MRTTKASGVRETLLLHNITLKKEKNHEESHGPWNGSSSTWGGPSPSDWIENSGRLSIEFLSRTSEMAIKGEHRKGKSDRIT